MRVSPFSLICCASYHRLGFHLCVGLLLGTLIDSTGILYLSIPLLLLHCFNYRMFVKSWTQWSKSSFTFFIGNILTFFFWLFVLYEFCNLLDQFPKILLGFGLGYVVSKDQLGVDWSLKIEYSFSWTLVYSLYFTTNDVYKCCLSDFFCLFWYLPSGLGCNQFHNFLLEKKMYSLMWCILYTFTRPGLLIVVFFFFGDNIVGYRIHDFFLFLSIQ